MNKKKIEITILCDKRKANNTASTPNGSYGPAFQHANSSRQKTITPQATFGGNKTVNSIQSHHSRVLFCFFKNTSDISSKYALVLSNVDICPTWNRFQNRTSYWSLTSLLIITDHYRFSSDLEMFPRLSLLAMPSSDRPVSV